MPDNRANRDGDASLYDTLRNDLEPVVENLERRLFIAQRTDPSAPKKLIDDLILPIIEKYSTQERSLDETPPRRMQDEIKSRINSKSQSHEKPKPSRPGVSMDNKVVKFIMQMLSDVDEMSLKEMYTHIYNNDELVATEGNLSVILHRLVELGEIHRPGRGVYAIGPDPVEERQRYTR